MQTLLANVAKSQVLTDPFPHLVVRDAVPSDIYPRLLAEYPAQNVFAEGAAVSSNQRLNLLASQTLECAEVSPLWREFVRLHTSKLFFAQLINVFGDHIRSIYPSFEKKIGRLNDLSAELRSSQNADVFLDALICLNSPVVGGPSSVRRAHVDDPHKLFTGIYYLRDPDDTSTGGDLEFYRFKGRTRFRIAEVDDRHVQVVKTIKYQANTLVLFVNNINALHGVTERSVTPFPRYLFNLVVELRHPLFDLWKYQEVRFSRAGLSQLARRLLHWRV